MRLATISASNSRLSNKLSIRKLFERSRMIPRIHLNKRPADVELDARLMFMNDIITAKFNQCPTNVKLFVAWLLKDSVRDVFNQRPTKYV